MPKLPHLGSPNTKINRKQFSDIVFLSLFLVNGQVVGQAHWTGSRCSNELYSLSKAVIVFQIL